MARGSRTWSLGVWENSCESHQRITLSWNEIISKSRSSYTGVNSTTSRQHWHYNPKGNIYFGALGCRSPSLSQAQSLAYGPKPKALRRQAQPPKARTSKLRYQGTCQMRWACIVHIVQPEPHQWLPQVKSELRCSSSCMKP